MLGLWVPKRFKFSEINAYESQLYAFVDSPEMLPFIPYLESLPELGSFDNSNNPLIDILNHFDYIYESESEREE